MEDGDDDECNDVDNVDEYHFNGIFALIYILHICEYDKEIIGSYVPI